MAQVNLGHVVGPGVPTGGTAGQVLVKNGATNFDASWQNLNQNAAIENIQDGLAIVANGNTHAAIASGQYVYVKNHGTLAEGLYKATAAIGTNATLSTSNLTADSKGGLNDLQGQVDTLNSKITDESYEDIKVGNVTIGYVNKIDKMCIVTLDNKSASFPATGIQLSAEYKADSNYYNACKYFDGTDDVGGLLNIAYNSSILYLKTIKGQSTAGTYVTGTLVYFSPN